MTQRGGNVVNSATSNFAQAAGVFFLEARSHLSPGASKPQTPAKIKATGATLASHKQRTLKQLLGQAKARTSSLPVTLVPGPALLGRFGSEIRAAEVHDPGGEAEQPPVSIRPVHPGRRRGQAVLLVGTGQQMEGPVLQVGRLLDQLRVQNQIRRR